MAEKWIPKTMNRGALKRAFPNKAKGGFSNAELRKIIKSKTSTVQEKRRANLALTLKGFKKV
jgi:hypothetical protein